MKKELQSKNEHEHENVDENEEEKEENIDLINDGLEQQYFSRAELIRNLKFPRSNNRKVIILPNNEGLGFRYDCYNPQILSGYLSEKEFRDSVYELTKICSLHYANKLKREKGDPFLLEKKMLLWNIPLLLIAIILFALRVFDTVKNNYTFELGVALFAIGILFIIVNFINCQTKKPDLTNFETTTQAELEKKILDINRKYISRKIKWIIHPKFYWVEILIL